MKAIKILSIVAGIIAAVSCSKTPYAKVKDPITISSPAPTEEITKVVLDDIQKEYALSGNDMAFRLLREMYDGRNLVCSPLSLQYALAMTANGADGETLQEIIDFLGYGNEGIDALNEYNKVLMEQLPAVDLDVTIKVTDALLVNKDFPLLPGFKGKMEEYYYAAVDNMDFSDPQMIASRINEWASRSTNGFINNILDDNEISADAVSYIMNALYFKAKWAGSEFMPMFREESTKEEYFHSPGATNVKVKMMRNMRRHKYAEMDGFKVLALPYADGKFYMYFLLPDKNDIDWMVDQLKTVTWSEILANIRQDADVYVKIPKFDIECKHNLNDVLIASGVKKAFQCGSAEFGNMFSGMDDYYFWINKVIQKSRISVSEWGTEAASVTIVEMDGATSPGPEDKEVYFYADHPFIFLIGESTSGTILFEGIVMEP